MNIKQDFKKYRQFITTSKKLIVGGKSAEQNEQLVKDILKSGKNYIVMHTAKPGSPFVFIIVPASKTKARDINQAAVFCATYSKDWRDNKQDVIVHMFKTKEIYKRKAMKTGTFGVRKFKIIKVKKEEIIKFKNKIIKQ